jgi:hypothetical protein
MVDVKFIEVIAPVTDALFLEHLLDEIDHVSRVVCPVIAAIDEEYIKLLPVKPEFLFFPGFFILPARAGALRAFFRWAFALVDKAAHMTFPGITCGRAGRFRFL